MDADMAREMALDQEVALKYVAFLVSGSATDSPEARQSFCEAEKIPPKLLWFNPNIQSIARLFAGGSNIERMLDLSLRDWLLYHHHYVHQGYRYAEPELQQTWLGREILKSPFDCWIYQEIIWRTRPDWIIELGVMFGGASHFFASLCDLVGHGQVLGVDISLAKAGDPQNDRIEYLEGSSTSAAVFEEVARRVSGGKVLVIADSDHEKDHVLAELNLYSRLVPVGCYYVVEDTLNDVMGWHPVPNEGPQAAAKAFLAQNRAFIADRRWAERYILSLNPLGYLLRVSDDAS